MWFFRYMDGKKMTLGCGKIFEFLAPRREPNSKRTLMRSINFRWIFDNNSSRINSGPLWFAIIVCFIFQYWHSLNYRKNRWFWRILFKFRSFVRLAEHDKRIDTDTKHEDVKVTKSTPHKEFDGLTNDILMLYLEKDVTFRGKAKEKLF